MAMKVTMISVGKIKDKYIQLGIDEFKKRLNRFCKLTFIEVKDEALKEKLTEKELELIRIKEGQLILTKLPVGAYVIIMDIDGKQLSSEELAHQLKDVATYHGGHVVFIIGGSIGLSQEVKSRGDLLLSFSKMTFPHQLFKLMLLEQIYRGFKINANESYHK